MDPRRIASIAAVLGGVGWLAKVFLIWRSGGEDTELASQLALFGWAMLALALMAAGYTLVEKAPVWLRGVVAVATALLVLMLWQLLDQGIKATYEGESWLRDELSVAIAGLIAVVMGLWGFTRHRPEPPQRNRKATPPPRGRRAAR
jgi:hypothetical protein